MPKHKPKRGSPTIDMTAMCDVAFLLLTFFMLTAKMKNQESVVIDTPSSISETKLPDANTLTILVSSEGKIFVDMTGSHTRENLIAVMNDRYNLGLNTEDQKRFANAGGFGVPLSALKQWLEKKGPERTDFEKQYDGIPIDTADVNKSELANWIHLARVEQAKLKNAGEKITDYVIILKADQETPYPVVQRVINTLTDINVNRFNLITDSETDPNKPKKKAEEG